MQKQPQQEAALLTWSEQQDPNPRMTARKACVHAFRSHYLPQ
mgnify:FL=1